MEHQSSNDKWLVSIMELEARGANVWCYRYIVIHETGHEWFGNGVTASDPPHLDS